MDNSEEKILGVLGGVGPLATVYFTELIVKMTEAHCDQEHLFTLVSNHAAIPDRTAYIMDNTQDNPLPVMIRDAKMLENAGVSVIAIPCNTAHYFFEKIQNSVSVPVLNIIEETVRYALKTVKGLHTLGILATEGTVYVGAYQKVCKEHGLYCAVPSADDERSLMNIIYNQVKAGHDVDYEEFQRIVNTMLDADCDAVVLGCTELSVVWENLGCRQDNVIDSMEVLARVSIESCGKKIKEPPVRQPLEKEFAGTAS